ncbi:hypothetical protein F220043C3_43290 [Enterocloster asparagiformis]|uniref:SufE family protein n=1 Tax=Enterocloster asparagiformis TaxID=333367 RepID=UPI0034AE6600
MTSLQLLHQWCERFRQADLLEQYDILLEQGMKLKEDAAVCLEENKIPGCKVNFYLKADRREGKLEIRARSDSLLVCGVIAILKEIYEGDTEEIRAEDSPIKLVEAIEDRIINPDIKRNGLKKLCEAMETAVESR